MGKKVLLRIVSILLDLLFAAGLTYYLYSQTDTEPHQIFYLYILENGMMFAAFFIFLIVISPLIHYYHQKSIEAKKSKRSRKKVDIREIMIQSLGFVAITFATCTMFIFFINDYTVGLFEDIFIQMGYQTESYKPQTEEEFNGWKELFLPFSDRIDVAVFPLFLVITGRYILELILYSFAHRKDIHEERVEWYARTVLIGRFFSAPLAAMLTYYYLVQMVGLENLNPTTLLHGMICFKISANVFFILIARITYRMFVAGTEDE